MICIKVYHHNTHTSPISMFATTVPIQNTGFPNIRRLDIEIYTTFTRTYVEWVLQTCQMFLPKCLHMWDRRGRREPANKSNSVDG